MGFVLAMLPFRIDLNFKAKKIPDCSKSWIIKVGKQNYCFPLMPKSA